jgi:hypothetical protein
MEIDIVLTNQRTKNELVKRFLIDLRKSKKLSYNYIVKKFNNPFSMHLLRAIKYFL